MSVPLYLVLPFAASTEGLRLAELARSKPRDRVWRVMSFDPETRLQSGELVLVVDDGDIVPQSARTSLENAGFRLESAETSARALRAARGLHPAVILLAGSRSPEEATSLCRVLRADPGCTEASVLMISARCTETDRVRGFEAGADDYVTAPFGVREFVMRVRSLAARARDRRLARRSSAPPRRLAWHGLEVDPLRHHVAIDGVTIAVRPLEFKLLTMFLENPQRVLTRTELLRDVWGLCPETNTGTVDTHIRRLRERLGPYSRAIETVYGFGYRLRVERRD